MKRRKEAHMTFRERVLEIFRGQLGEPDQIGHDSAGQFRWAVRRPGRVSLNVYLNFGSDGPYHRGHVLIGDPCAPLESRIESFAVKDDEDLVFALDRLRAHSECA
jgi:hypothetical protein